MIELFDREALLPKRDPSLWAAGGVLLLAAVALGGYTLWLKHLLQRTGQERQRLEAHVRLLDDQKPANPALLTDLRAQAEALEGSLAALRPSNHSLTMRPSQWLDRLDGLAAPGLSLTKVDIDPSGAARINGQATNTQVVNGFVQAWARQDVLARLNPRSIEVKQEDVAPAPGAGPGPVAVGGTKPPAATVLRFELRVAAPHAPTPAATPAAKPTAAASSPASTTAAARTP